MSRITRTASDRPSFSAMNDFRRRSPCQCSAFLIEVAGAPRFQEVVIQPGWRAGKLLRGAPTPQLGEWEPVSVLRRMEWVVAPTVTG